VGSPHHQEPSPWDGRDPERVAEAVDRAGQAARLLAVALEDAARSLQAPPEPLDERAGPRVDRDVDRTGDPVAEQSQRPPRRTPLRLRRGVHEGTAEGLEQLLSTEGVTAIVDGYNVTKEGWPNLDLAQQRSALIPALGAIRSRTGANVHVVFDGDDAGDRPAVSAPLPVRVHFSPAEVEADDVILQMVASIPTDVPVIVVSSDRRVADGARRLGANAVRSEQLLDLIGR
jgi:predicted RNA-binding protein with PIN domain